MSKRAKPVPDRSAQQPEDSLGSPTLSIYQNPEHVSGLLQQVYREPLLTDGSREQSNERASSASTERAGGVDVNLELSIPALGSAGVGAKGDRGRTADESAGASSRSVQNFVYSQAYYLYLVRDKLRAAEKLKVVSAPADADGLRSGDFIEFQASFRPNELGALLDVLTPELIGEITRFRLRTEGIRKYEGWDDFEKVKNFSFLNQERADVFASLATAVTSAVRADFRSETTREFYGQIGTPEDHVTAITICDNNHFVVDDVDRILDGEFTVLGKVISSPAADVPVLERNKVLERIRPAAVDQIFSAIQSAVDARGEAPGSSQLLGGLSGADMVDLELSSRIDGVSFRVVPIAIYA